MDPKDDHAIESRPPELGDLVSLCDYLNKAGAKYIVVGGMAIIQHGFVRATEDIDLLVDVSPDNERRVYEALMYLPDQAVKGLNPGDVGQYTVVRVADEIVIDLMRSACGIEYAEAANSIVLVTIQGVPIPFASLDLLWRMKQTLRDKDALDRLFLQRKLGK